MKLVLVKGGSFTMGGNPSREDTDGDERQFKATITKDYYIGIFECTQSQYAEVMGSNPSQFQGKLVNGSTSNFPVEQVSWTDAVKFCKKLSELPKERAAGRTYRLPTEAEWEYACRAGTQTVFCFGDDPGKLGEYAWFSGNGQGRTHAVGKKKPNAWGMVRRLVRLLSSNCHSRSERTSERNRPCLSGWQLGLRPRLLQVGKSDLYLGRFSCRRVLFSKHQFQSGDGRA
jgi:hypothetical protein